MEQHRTLRLEDLEAPNIGKPNSLACYFQKPGGKIVGPGIIANSELKAFQQRQALLPVTERVLCKAFLLD